MLLAFGMSMAVALATARHRDAKATASLASAAARLDSLTDIGPADDSRRAAIAWGYSERMRLGLESPFRLVEAAARDSRLTPDERHLISWALLSRVLRGETHDVDPAALDGLGPSTYGVSASGDQHLDLIEGFIAPADNPRAAELAVRLAYSLAAAERIVDGSAPTVAAEAAAMIADRELGRREAAQVVRAANGSDPIDVVRRRRAQRSFYVERPVLMNATDAIERSAVAGARDILQALRAMVPSMSADSSHALDANAATLAPRLFAAGAFVLPNAPLTVTVRRYLPLVRAQVRRLDEDALARTQNAEMLVGVTRMREPRRAERRVVGRMLLAAGVSVRSLAQEPVWFPGDEAPPAEELISTYALRGIAFDAAIPTAWRPYYLRALRNAITDLHRVLPGLRLDGLQVRFRMNAPADSALAMHDPRTRTLHLPVISAGGTLTHELAHDLDRLSAQQLGLAGYRSDIVARVATLGRGSNSKLAASLLALTEESESTRGTHADRPAEIFATRVDWFVASALARVGRSNGFLSAAQDELITGHVVHPQRLRNVSSSRSLVSALEGMTSVAPFAIEERHPTVQTLLRWSLNGPVDRRIAGDIVRGGTSAWAMPSLARQSECDVDGDPRVRLVRMAAESRARGWVRLRARWTSDSLRAGWMRSVLRQGPWSEGPAEHRTAQLRAHILESLASNADLPTGLTAYAAPVAARAALPGGLIGNREEGRGKREHQGNGEREVGTDSSPFPLPFPFLFSLDVPSSPSLFPVPQ